jgi:hypothetical protein
MFAVTCMVSLMMIQVIHSQFVIQNELKNLQGEWFVVAADFGFEESELPPGLLLGLPDRLGWLVGMETWTFRGTSLTLDYQPTFFGGILGYGIKKDVTVYLEEKGGKTRTISVRAGKPENPFCIGPSKSPKRIDGVFDVFDGRQPAIYRLDKDDLKIAIPVHSPFEEKPDDRPGSFATGKECEIYVVSLRRKQPSK